MRKRISDEDLFNLGRLMESICANNTPVTVVDSEILNMMVLELKERRALSFLRGVPMTSKEPIPADTPLEVSGYSYFPRFGD